MCTARALQTVGEAQMPPLEPQQLLQGVDHCQ